MVRETPPWHDKDSCFWEGLLRNEETWTWRDEGYRGREMSPVSTGGERSNRRGVSPQREKNGEAAEG